LGGAFDPIASSCSSQIRYREHSIKKKEDHWNRIDLKNLLSSTTQHGSHPQTSNFKLKVGNSRRPTYTGTLFSENEWIVEKFGLLIFRRHLLKSPKEVQTSIEIPEPFAFASVKEQWMACHPHTPRCLGQGVFQLHVKSCGFSSLPR
jgi:hypothetical protein